MASDRDLISSEDHELNYVLKKWGKKQSIANREKLIGYLKSFRADIEYKPHNRENFYRYMDNKNLKINLEETDTTQILENNNEEDDTDSTKVYNNDEEIKTSGNETKISNESDEYDDTQNLSSDKTDTTRVYENSSQPQEKKKNGILLPIIIIIGVILLIIIFVLFFRFCGCKPPVVTTTTTTMEDTTTTSSTTTTTIEEKIFTDKSLKEEIEKFSPIYFIPNKTVLISGEEQKITKLVEYMNNYTKIELKIEGHCAKVGRPAKEKALSIKRAETIKNMILSENRNIIISTEGFGSEKEAVTNPQNQSMASKNRRTEIIVITAESEK